MSDKSVELKLEENLHSLLSELAEIYDESLQDFMHWMIQEHLESFLANYDSTGQALSEYLCKKHSYDAAGWRKKQ
jgi:hypothetical protein